MTRRHNFQTFSWFYDIFKRDLLDLDPSYQRRSVWNQSFKNYFVEMDLPLMKASVPYLHQLQV